MVTAISGLPGISFSIQDKTAIVAKSTICPSLITSLKIACKTKAE
jgi:hypothetical protein